LGEDDGATGSVREALEHLDCRIGLAARQVARQVARGL